MSKLTIMRGLPASGKTTRAKEIMEASGNMIRVNKDLLREMLHFSKWKGSNESITKAMAYCVAKQCLISGINVIIDDTNLNEGTFQGWKGLAKEMELEAKVVKMDTSLEECLKRDLTRKKSVGENVIIGMAMQHGLYPKPKKGIIICDIDGTLAEVTHRRKYSSGPEKNWDKFFSLIHEDDIRKDVSNKLYKFADEGYKIFFVSGRPEKYREETKHWIGVKTYGELPYETIFMRPNNDKRDDTEVKKDIYNKYFKDLVIHKVLDDRPRVIKMWKEQGLDVEDVGDGIDF
jgi:predicted kinase